MPQIFKGRFTVKTESEFVVFILGARVNKWWKFSKWWIVVGGMIRMQKAIRTDTSIGFLGEEQFVRFFPLEILNIQYWKSFEHLEKFASNRDLPHAKSWADFVKKVGATGDVGIYHETYKVKPGDFECIYSNMPRHGLGAIFDHVPVQGKGEQARGRFQK